MLLFFFINKPITFLWYMLTLIALFILMILLDGSEFLGSFLASFVTFSINYNIYLFWRCFIKNADKDSKIKNISLRCLKPYFEFYWIIISFFLILLFIPTYFFFKIHQSESIMGISIAFLIITFICSKILEKSLLVAFISEGIRNNVDIKNTSIDSIYADAREILTKNLINAKQIKDL